MPKKPKEHEAAERLGRPVRADARRNEDAVLEAARTIFLHKGVDAPVRDVAAMAGVGIGTLYRRFPKRADLVAAVFRREVDVCAAAARSLAKDHPPGEALALWLERYSGFIRTKKGLAAALHSGDSAFDELPAYFRAQFEPALTSLLDAAVAQGQARAGIAPYDLLRAIGNLSIASGEGAEGHTRAMVQLLIDGLMSGVSKRD